MPNTVTQHQSAVDKLNAVKKQKFVEAYRQLFGHITQSCQIAGISRTTYYKWLEDDPSFLDEVVQAESELNDDIRDVLINKASSGDMTAVIFYLKNRHPDFKPQPTTLIQNNTVITDKRKEYELE